ncbi:hypothetical protein Aoc01nite_10270 [Actinoplanes octamycinicus]|nr:hypothetical protein Aoc01nite_10270 [Actinoplanes octamycinicus]
MHPRLPQAGRACALRYAAVRPLPAQPRVIHISASSTARPREILLSRHTVLGQATPGRAGTGKWPDRKAANQKAAEPESGRTGPAPGPQPARGRPASDLAELAGGLALGAVSGTGDSPQR